MRRILTISLIINLLFIALAVYSIVQKSGIQYIKRIIFTQKPHPSEPSYFEIKNEMHTNEKIDPGSMVFIGDSFMDLVNWNDLFPDIKIVNRGISGDIIPGLTGRIGPVLAAGPAKIFIIVGTNDINRGYPADTILYNYQLLLEKIQRNAPNTKVYIHSIAPTLYDASRPNSVIVDLNNRLKPLVEAYNYTFIDLFNSLKSENNALIGALTFDGLHLNKKGYLVWKEVLEPYIIE
jgi:lysophospholipase L1-like esterase